MVWRFVNCNAVDEYTQLQAGAKLLSGVQQLRKRTWMEGSLKNQAISLYDPIHPPLSISSSCHMFESSWQIALESNGPTILTGLSKWHPERQTDLCRLEEEEEEEEMEEGGGSSWHTRDWQLGGALMGIEHGTPRS